MLGDDFILPVANQGKIEAGILAMNAVFGRTEEPLPNIGGVQERLGRDAPNQQTSSTQPGVFFDNRCLETVLTRTNGRRVATRTTPDDNHVVCHLFFSVAGEATWLR